MPVPGLGQVDQRELESLAPVHGQHADRALVGLEPPGPSGALLARASAIRARSHSTRALTPSWPETIGGMQALSEVPEVGEPALAAGVGQQPLHQPHVGAVVSSRAATPRLASTRLHQRTRWVRSISRGSSACGEVGEGPAEEAGQRGLADGRLPRLLQRDEQGQPVLGQRVRRRPTRSRA